MKGWESEWGSTDERDEGLENREITATTLNMRVDSQN